MTSLALEPQFTTQELADLWKLSPQKIREMFSDEPGVMRIGDPSRRVGRQLKRSYYTLRIPASVAERVFTRLSSSPSSPKRRG
jgi:hypothetical protein